MIASNEKPSVGDEFLALCFEACRHAGVQIHAAHDREGDLTPPSAFCRIEGVGHLYLSDRWNDAAKRQALLTALAQSGAANGYLPPKVREAVVPVTLMPPLIQTVRSSPATPPAKLIAPVPVAIKLELLDTNKLLPVKFNCPDETVVDAPM